MSSLAQVLAHVDGDVLASLQDVPVPMYVLDRRGRIVWLNDAAEELVPGATGKRFTDVLAPDYIHSARRIFARRILGQGPFTDHTTVINLPDGRRIEVDISSVPLRKGHQIVGVFGVVRALRPVVEATAEEGVPALTPRQHEVLRLLGAGMTTAQMAEAMGLSPETVRNHVKATLGELNAKSRLEAVLTAYRLGLLPAPGRHAGD
ncbi:MAG TPA: LuxR C-terminal-related transcriptional regulator [Gaiellaceae bacterium]|nr:LuxR C-terminal-related transcriptional regulator [Gaiellaceae bacterium]